MRGDVSTRGDMTGCSLMGGMLLASAVACGCKFAAITVPVLLLLLPEATLL